MRRALLRFDHDPDAALTTDVAAVAQGRSVSFWGAVANGRAGLDGKGFLDLRQALFGTSYELLTRDRRFKPVDPARMSFFRDSSPRRLVVCNPSPRAIAEFVQVDRWRRDLSKFETQKRLGLVRPPPESPLLAGLFADDATPWKEPAAFLCAEAEFLCFLHPGGLVYGGAIGTVDGSRDAAEVIGRACRSLGIDLQRATSWNELPVE